MGTFSTASRHGPADGGTGSGVTKPQYSLTQLTITRMICKQCGTVHRGEHVLPGSGWIEFVLYFAYVFPGIIYSIWRRSKRHPTCAACGSRDLVGAQTPVGQKLAREFYPDGIPAAPAVVMKAPTAADRIVHRITVVLLWLLGSVVILTFGVVMLASWLR